MVWNPAEEVAALRTAIPVATLPMTRLVPNTAISLQASQAGDIEIFFEVPKTDAMIEIKIGDSGSCYLNFVLGATAAACGYNATKAHTGFGSAKSATDSIPLLGDETYLQMRVLIDGSVGECYWQEGRVAMTVRESLFLYHLR
eukprot:SAG31_NODE_1186_length_9492_cov_70.124987_3_plen_143_part_00